MPIYPVKDKKGKTIKYEILISYTDSNGKYKQIHRCNKRTSTLSGAKLLEAELIAKLRVIETTSLSEENIKYIDLYNSFIEVKKDEVKLTTLQKTMQHQKNHILDFFANKRINDITTKDILKWKSIMNEKKLKVAMKNKVYSSLKEVLNFGVKHFDLKSNVCNKVSNFKDPNLVEDETIHFWTIDEFNLFINTLKKDCEDASDIHYWNYYVLFNILYFAGLRKGEAYALRWTDYDPIKKTLHITKSITQKINDMRNFETSPKNKSSVRKIKISNRLATILDEHLERFNKVYLFDKKSKDWFICGGLEPLRDTTVCKLLKQYAKQLSLEQIRIHDLRHSFASLLINGGVDIKIIAEMMGHARVDMTWNRYGHLYPNAQNIATDYIDSL